MHFLTFGGELTSPGSGIQLAYYYLRRFFAAYLEFSGGTHADGRGGAGVGSVACIVVIIL